MPGLRRRSRLTARRLQRVVPVAVAGPTRPVVRAEVRAVRVVRCERVVVLGSALDLLLRAVDEDLLLGLFDPADDAGRDHDLLAEDPWPRVDHDVAAADVVGRLVDLADRAVDRLHPEARHVGVGVHDVRAEVGPIAVVPDVQDRHVLHVSPFGDPRSSDDVPAARGSKPVTGLVRAGTTSAWPTTRGTSSRSSRRARTRRLPYSPLAPSSS